MERKKRRQYLPKGQRKQYTTLRIDIDKWAILKGIAEKEKISMAEVTNKAVDALVKLQANELG